MTKEITNSDDIIDSRDVIERVEELEDELVDAMEDEGTTLETANDIADELKPLKALAKEASEYASDWQYGEALIRDSYFEDYAQELADDIGAIPDGYTWPTSCIDWKAAARDLQVDYTEVDFDGVSYWIRCG